MAAAPQLAPDDADHLLRSSSIVTNIKYQSSAIIYGVFDDRSTELFRLTLKPVKVTVNGTALEEVQETSSEGWLWQSLPVGGVLTLKHSKGNQIEIIK